MDKTRVPQVSSTELQSFHETHFGAATTTHFTLGFINPDGAWPWSSSTDAQEQETGRGDDVFDDDDDGLGYYPDGVKRTLTDEQIAMFRHSEIEALRREREKEQEQAQLQEQLRESRDHSPAADQTQTQDLQSTSGPTAFGSSSSNFKDNLRPGVRFTEQPQALPTEQNSTETDGTHKNKKRKKSNTNNNKQQVKKEPKPDLRKRTWDVVDKGLDSLDYDDM